jgi:hypothetical protein
LSGWVMETDFGTLMSHLMAVVVLQAGSFRYYFAFC